jgi:hypothetical protein
MVLDPSDPLTVCLSQDGLLAAVAWRGEDLITVAFYENVVSQETDEYVFTHLYEIRAFAAPDDYPLAMPPEELAARLERWSRFDYKEIQSEYHNGLSERSLRNVPFHRMAQEAASAYFDSEASSDLIVPTDEDLSACRAAGPWVEFRSVRDMDSAFDQLKAVAAYVAAVSAGDPKPIVAAARTMFGDEEQTHVTRLRNLIQFARQNGYLTTLQHGRSGGVPTRKALDLIASIKERAAHANGGKA